MTSLTTNTNTKSCQMNMTMHSIATFEMLAARHLAFQQAGSTNGCHAVIDTCPRVIPRQQSHRQVPPLGTHNTTTAHHPPQQQAPLLGGTQKRRVHFDLDQDDFPKQSVYEYDAIPRELIPDLFWSREERRRMKSTQKRWARQVAQVEPQLVSSIKCLRGYNNNNHAKGGNRSQCFSDEIEDSNGHCALLCTTESAQRILTESETRGLENFLTPLLSEHRSWAIQKVLSIQARCRALGSEEEADQLETLLHIWSQRVSAAPSRFAHRMAAGDAYQAALIWKEDNCDIIVMDSTPTHRYPCTVEPNLACCDATAVLAAQ